jgi:hypothetical protein
MWLPTADFELPALRRLHYATERYPGKSLHFSKRENRMALPLTSIAGDRTGKVAAK